MVPIQVKIPEMIKYPKVKKPLDLVNFLKEHPEYRTLTAFVEPKYDGSNITVWRGILLTRNHYLLGTTDLIDGFLLYLDPKKRETILKLSYEFQLFFELGGIANAPAGYVRGWDKPWDAVVFDIYIPGAGFIEPTIWRKRLREIGTPFKLMTLEEIADNWIEMLKEYPEMEGFVAKVYDPPRDMKMHFDTGLNMIAFKFKHEYLRKPKKKKKKRVKLPPLDYSEVLSEVERAHHEILGEEICNKRKALPTIAKLVQEEAAARNMSVPKGNVIYKAWEEYTRGVCHG